MMTVLVENLRGSRKSLGNGASRMTAPGFVNNDVVNCFFVEERMIV